MSKFFKKSEYQEISNIFNLGTVISVTPFTKGLWTPKVLMKTSKGSFVVSKHKSHNLETLTSKSLRSLQYEIDLLKVLKTLPTPHPIQSKTKKFIVVYKDFPVTVTKFISGHSPKKLTPTMLYSLGKFLGEFHIVGKKLKKDLKERRKFYHFPDSIVNKMMPVIKKQKHLLLKSVVDEIKSGVIRTRLPSTLPKGPIHSDFKPDNELFVKGKLSGVIDFGNFYIDVLLLDIGKAIMWNCISSRKLDKSKMKSFLKGYSSKRPLNVEEKKYLKQSILFAIYSHIFVDLYHAPLKIVPESYTRYLVTEFLPAAREIEKNK